MAKKFTHFWCPNGCGKKVIWSGKRNDIEKNNFYCLECHSNYTKKEIDKWKNL